MTPPPCALTCGRVIDPGYAIGSYRLCQPCYDLAWAIAADAGIAPAAAVSLPLPPCGDPTLTMPKTTIPTKPCKCGGTIIRKSNRGKWPKACEACRDTPARAADATGDAEERDETSSEASCDFDVMAFIGAQEMDYHVGSAFRFVAEHRDGDELANLRAAREHLDYAIAARER